MINLYPKKQDMPTVNKIVSAMACRTSLEICHKFNLKNGLHDIMAAILQFCICTFSTKNCMVIHLAFKKWWFSSLGLWAPKYIPRGRFEKIPHGVGYCSSHNLTPLSKNIVLPLFHNYMQRYHIKVHLSSTGLYLKM